MIGTTQTGGERTIPDWLGKLEISWDAAMAMLATLAIIAIALLLRLAITRFIVGRYDDPIRRYTIIKTTGYVLGVAALVVLVKIWFGGMVDIASFLGLLSAGLAVALHEPITNLAGWIFIVVRQPFKVGDRIELENGQAGDVIDVRLFMFSILEIGNWVAADQSTGRIMHVPNGSVFRYSVANYTQGFPFIWNELPVTITFESNWQKAHQILTQIVNQKTDEITDRAREKVLQTARRYMIFYTKLTPIVWVSVADIGVTLTMRYLCEARKRRSSATTLWKAILEEFAGHPDIDFAYPTTRIYSNRLEGKSGTGGPAAAHPGQSG